MNFDFRCPHCGQMVTAEDAMGGQVVECPRCGRGIVVPNVTESACAADGVNAADGKVIPPEDFGEALAACRRDPVFEEVFAKAPRNARLFLGVKAYCLHFGKGFDDAEVSACLGDVESDLSQDDIDFLLAHESDSLIRERLLAIKSGGCESSQSGGMSVPDSFWEPREGFFTRAFVQPLGILLCLMKRCLVRCPSCGWIGSVVAGVSRGAVRCCKCGGTMPLKESMASYTRVRDEGNSLSLEYSKRKKAREDFFAQAKAFEEDWEFFNELSSQRKINRIKEETDRLYRKMANLNADRIINSQRATAASNRAFGNTVGGTAGAFVSLAGSVAMWAEESSGKRLASQKMDIEQLIEHNEALLDHYNDIVEEFSDVEKDVARRRRLKSRCGYADESELPTLDLPLDHDRVERCKALDEKMLDGDLLYFTGRFLIGLMCLIGITLVLAFVNTYAHSWKHLEEQAIQFNRTHVVVPEETPYEKTDLTVLENLAVNGDLAAKWRLGMRLVLGDGCEQDVYRGAGLLKQSAEGGFGLAWTSLSALYFSGSHGDVLVSMKQDMAKAFQCAEKAMASGDSPWATSVCGILLLIGEGAEKDPKRGCEYLQRMADRGYPLAEWALADYYLGLKGNEARGDMKDKGVKLLIRAALKGNLDAMERYASILEKGDGVIERDEERAKFWREKARVGREELNRKRKEQLERLSQTRQQNRQTMKTTDSDGQLQVKATPIRQLGNKRHLPGTMLVQRLEDGSSEGGAAVPSTVLCPVCQGDKKIRTSKVCPVCGGKEKVDGEVDCSSCSGSGQVKVRETCPACRGRGKERCDWCKGSGKEKCYDCGGSGRVTETKEVNNSFSVRRGSGSRTVTVRVTCRSCGGRGSSTCTSCSGHGYSGSSCGRCDGRGRLTSSSYCQTCRGGGKVAGQKKCDKCENGKVVEERDCARCDGRGRIPKQ